MNLRTIPWAFIFISPLVHAQATAPLPVIPKGLNAKYSLVTTRAQSVTAIYSCEIKAPQLEAQEWLLFAAKPGHSPGQRVSRVSCDPKAKIVSEKSSQKRDIFLSRVEVKGAKHAKGIEFKMTVQADLYARALVSRSHGSKIASIGKKEREHALLATKHFNYSSPTLRNWMKEHQLYRKTKEGSIDFSRRVFKQIVKQSKYHYVGAQNRTASHVCSSKKSDCGGLAILFCSVLRSQGIPARILVGRWAMSAKAGAKVGAVTYTQQHVKAEFFAQGVGWVPVDLSSAILHDKTAGKLRYFGRDRGDFITMHYDADIMLDSIYFGVQEMDFLQRAAYWATGTGGFNGHTCTEGWVVTPREASPSGG